MLKNVPFLSFVSQQIVPFYIYIEVAYVEHSNSLLVSSPRYLPRGPGFNSQLFFPLALAIEDIYPPAKCPPFFSRNFFLHPPCSCVSRGRVTEKIAGTSTDTPWRGASPLRFLLHGAPLRTIHHTTMALQ